MKKIIQVGTGGFGSTWLEILKDDPQTDVVAIVDVVEENLEKAKKMMGTKEVHYYLNHVEAFEQEEADIAVVITPPQTHKQIAMDALENNLHVFMEKPLAHTKEEADALYELAKNYEQYVVVSQNYRYRPEIQAIKQAVEQQAAGPIEYAEWNFQRASKFGGWRDNYQEIIIEDMSIHHFDLLRYILGKNADTVYAKSMRPSWSWFKGNPTASVLINMEGILVNYFASWVTSGPETSWNGECKLYGKQGVIALINDLPVIIKPNGEEQSIPVPDMKRQDRAFSINEMISAIEGGREPDNVISDNIHSFHIVSASLESIKLKREINLKEEISC
ncbi:Gfo/Idh/MocA family protein [Gracilibacillus alcaliphilus]|uniref:Gfo/Idh/MocA family protein n=1 Tax=Gracilibacillus alcaliphilus TaxID=1401441 RepID=UPI00195F1814|nr:Gfo/Idh/MocA family oxidoreductase [Gracilibacillus alcaliphilus]MBM7679499.1 putative dehydrogenase [Gracilibacillus alcaliphilus]